MPGWSINPFWDDEIEEAHANTYIDKSLAPVSSDTQPPVQLPAASVASKKATEKKKASAAETSRKRTASSTKKQKAPAVSRSKATSTASAASDGSDTDDDIIPATQPSLKRARASQFESEEEVLIEKGSKPVRAAILRSFLTQRGASGFTTQRDPTRTGEYFVEVRVYNSREAERLPADERWKHALTTLKVAADTDTPLWRAVSKLVQAGKDEFSKIRPVLYPSFQ